VSELSYQNSVEKLQIEKKNVEKLTEEIFHLKELNQKLSDTIQMLNELIRTTCTDTI